MPGNHTARPIYDIHHYVNPHIKKIRNCIGPLMTCNLCYEFFNSERNPRIAKDGRTVCSPCLRKILKSPPDVMNMLHPLNISYVARIAKFKDLLEMLYCQKSAAYCELERAIYKRNNSSFQLKSMDDLCTQRAFLVEEIAAHSKNIIIRNYIGYVLTSDALKAVEDCKQASSVKYVTDNLSKILFIGKSLGYPLKMITSLGSEDQWLLWNRNVESGIGIRAKSIVEKEAQQSFVSKFIDTYAFIIVDGVVRYSLMNSHDTGIIIPTFVRNFPSYSRLGIAEFVLYEINSLTHVYNVYFEIVIANSVCSEDESAMMACRFHIDIAIPNICVNIAYSFLGTDRLCFIGAEIEVTNNLIIFETFNENGKIVPANLPMPPSWTICRESVSIREGMALLVLKEQTTKLIIFKSSSVEANVVLYGNLNAVAMEALRMVPLGKHRIIGCGIEIRFTEDDFLQNKD